VPTTVALYILNQKRDSLTQLEARYNLRVLVARDDALIPPAFRLERLRAYSSAEVPLSPVAPLTQSPGFEDEEDESEQGVEASDPDRREEESEEERSRGRRRRRRRRRRDEETISGSATQSEVVEGAAEDSAEPVAAADGIAAGVNDDSEEETEAERRRRRRGRRGGRRRARRDSDFEPAFDEPRPSTDLIEILPVSPVGEPEPSPVGDLADMAEEMVRSGTGAVRETGPAMPRSVELPEEIAPEFAESVMPHAHPVEASAVGGAADLAGSDLPSAGATEQAGEAALSSAEPEHPVGTESEKPPAPRRGWWQRLIQP
jgi:ribonuclease E